MSKVAPFLNNVRIKIVRIVRSTPAAFADLRVYNSAPVNDGTGAAAPGTGQQTTDRTSGDAGNSKSPTGHVAIKRRRLSPLVDENATWLAPGQDYVDLVSTSEHFCGCIYTIYSFIQANPDRADINNTLRFLGSCLTGNLKDLGSRPSAKLDFEQIFERQLKWILNLCFLLYAPASQITRRLEHPTVPQTMAYGIGEHDKLSLQLTCKLLSAPAFLATCNRFLLQVPADGKNAIDGIDAISGKFLDRLLDTHAFHDGLPLPSFVVSEQYHENLRNLFPTPQRKDPNWTRLLPVASTLEKIDEEPAESAATPAENTADTITPDKDPGEVKEVSRRAPSPRPAATFRILPLPPAPVIQRTCGGKLDHMRADFMQREIEGITAEEFRARFYHESDAHRAIKETYVTDFVPREPLRLANGDARKNGSGQLLHKFKKADKPRDQAAQDDADSSEEEFSPRSILCNKRTPKRLPEHRLPKSVRFTEGTLSPQPRTHLGLDVPRLLSCDESCPLEELVQRYLQLDRPKMGLPAIKPGSRPNLFSAKKDKELAHEVIPLREDKEKACDTKIDCRIEKLFSEPSLLYDQLGFGAVQFLEETREARFAEIRKEAAEANAEARRLKRDIKEAAEAAKRSIITAENVQETSAKTGEAAQKITRAQVPSVRLAGLAESGVLRVPRQRLIGPISELWIREVQQTTCLSSNKVHARTSEGAELRRHDFATLVTPTEWLNDEIINGAITWVDKAVNLAAGIQDVRKQTRKCLAMNSFFFKSLISQGTSGQDRKLRRCGVTKANLLELETVLLPVCERLHWTLVVIRPAQRTVAHMDSLNARGSAQYTQLTLALLQSILEEKFVESEWRVVHHEAPMQTNGYDCGVFTITNAMCLALGLSPIDSYCSEQLPLQRLRIAAVLLNSGFRDAFELTGY